MSRNTAVPEKTATEGPADFGKVSNSAKRKKGDAMRTLRIITGSFAWIMIAMLLVPPGTMAQDSGESEETDRFRKEELTQMLAPLALYPDSLIAEILMASTYPLEIVEAERWLRQNKELKGDALNTAMQEKTWDPSVKSVCHFPDILFALSDKLDQTRKLGDAFLSQNDEVMAVIQELRHRAENQGNLKTTDKQKVIIEEKIIRIEPPAPEVLYVPAYDPLYVYGPWWYPAYPPYYWYYPAGYVSGGYISYGPRVFLGVGWSPWAWFDWPFHRVYVDVHKTKRFHTHYDKRDFDRSYWQHNPRHRRGVAYRDTRTSERFRPKPVRISPTSPETRGYPGRRIDRQEGRASQAPAERREGTITPGVRPERQSIQPTPRQDTPFRGIGDGNFERRAGERGNESRRSSEIRLPAGEIRRPTGEVRQPRGGEMRQPGSGSHGSGRSGGVRR
jgi:hypothetical protein